MSRYAPSARLSKLCNTAALTRPALETGSNCSFTPRKLRFFACFRLGRAALATFCSASQTPVSLLSCLLLALALFAADTLHGAESSEQASAQSGAQSGDDPVAHILARDAAPAGVVFEIVSGNSAYLDLALPRIESLSARLRERFPGLPVAVVSHGGEQFALASSAAQSNAVAHDSAQSLLADNVPVHICGTHASWRDLAAEDFPDYIDVAPSGPAQIRAYRELGYLLVDI